MGDQQVSWYWVSWEEVSGDYRPLTFPPNDRILGWWCTGEGPGYSTLCAAVKAETEDEARAAVLRDWPQAFVRNPAWRICQHCHGSWDGSDRFPLSRWMRPRMEALRQEATP